MFGWTSWRWLVQKAKIYSSNWYITYHIRTVDDRRRHGIAWCVTIYGDIVKDWMKTWADMIRSESEVSNTPLSGIWAATSDNITLLMFCRWAQKRYFVYPYKCVQMSCLCEGEVYKQILTLLPKTYSVFPFCHILHITTSYIVYSGYCRWVAHHFWFARSIFISNLTQKLFTKYVLHQFPWKILDYNGSNSNCLEIV